MPREGLLPGTPAIADGAAAPIPPPITTLPGLPPSRNTISVGDRAPVGTVRRTGRRPEVLGILEHLRLQTGNRRTCRQTQGIPRPQKTLASEGARHNRGAGTR